MSPLPLSIPADKSHCLNIIIMHVLNNVNYVFVNRYYTSDILFLLTIRLTITFVIKRKKYQHILFSVISTEK